jgi:hypothetical protein
MKFQSFALPALALGTALLLIGPAEESYGFSKIGGNLGLNQRDFRVRNNFLDAASNNNTSAAASWPGWSGAFLAVWKGHAEWNSLPHGPTATIGNGGANFDSVWGGEAAAVGSSNNNIVSALASGGACGGGVLAYTETPIFDGWRIRFCDSWTWADGPGGINFNQFDIQGVACHEYGHALGLGHSTFGQATMAPGTSQGATGPRTIHSDDIAGIQCIYGVADATKPVITATQGLGTTVNLFGNFFSPTNNEVWFTNATVTAVGADPRVIETGVNSSGGMISITIPANAGPGEVLVKIPGGNTGRQLSNSFPFDPNATIGTVPGCTGCVPNSSVAAEFVSDPAISDIGGDGAQGPKINDNVEVFDVALDCSGMSTAGVYSIVLRQGAATTPLSTSFGFLYNSGPVLVKSSGVHSQNTVTWGSTVLPNDPAFVGVVYTAQGFCSQTGGGRLSGGLIQTIGG